MLFASRLCTISKMDRGRAERNVKAFSRQPTEKRQVERSDAMQGEMFLYLGSVVDEGEV